MLPFLLTRTGLTSVVFLLFGTAFAGAATAPSSEQKWVRDTVPITRLAQAKDVEGFKARASALELEYRTHSPEEYMALMNMICQAASGSGFAVEKVDVSARVEDEFARLAFDHHPNAPLVSRMKMFVHLRFDVGNKDEGPKWSDAQRVRVTLKGLQEVMNAIDPDYDPKKEPFASQVIPPHTTAGGPGMDPKEIVDPIMRKEYEDKIAENTRRQKKALEQSRLRSFWRLERQLIINNVAAHFSRGPEPTEAVRAQLVTLALDPDLVAMIVENIGRDRAGISSPTTSPRN